MKVAVYPGSFNPWHEGHVDILRKALEIFDKVVVARGINPEKGMAEVVGWAEQMEAAAIMDPDMPPDANVQFTYFSGMLVDFVKEQGFHAVVRGLRNGHDLQYEMNQQFWNEDLGLKVPMVYFITDRKLSHISSSAIRALEKAKKQGA